MISLSRAPVTIALIVANVVVFVVDMLTPADQGNGLHRLMLAGAIIPQAVQAGEYYRIVTAGFLQFSITHIAFNMYALSQAGMVVENFYGSVTFFAIYAAALVSGGIAAYEWTLGSDAVTAGASGAIMGLFGAIFALGVKTPALRQSLVRWAAFPIIATLVVGFTSPNISNAGHIGGLLMGAVLGFVLPARRLRQIEDNVT